MLQAPPDFSAIFPQMRAIETLNYAPEVPLELESGRTLPNLEISYTDIGNPQGPVVWICHALTADANPSDWWEGLIGPDRLFDPAQYRIICANMLGSCYGTTGPLSQHPDLKRAYYDLFPEVTIRDMVKAHKLLQHHLGIRKIYTLMGGSMGGQQAMEWAIQEPTLAENLVLLATNARHSPWGIAFNEAQRMAIKSDRSFLGMGPRAGEAGLRSARAIALLSYRNYDRYQTTQLDEDAKTENFKAASYQQYQGDKLAARFNAHSYWVLSKAMDSHNVGRGWGSEPVALSRISARTLVIGLSSDLLFPLSEQEYLARHISGAQLEVIDSRYGHDGFLTETGKITEVVRQFQGQVRYRRTRRAS